MSLLRKRMIADLSLADKAPSTIEAYVGSVAAFAKFLGRSPDQASQDDLRRWIGAEKERVGPSRLIQHIGALKFLFGKTLGRPELVTFLSYPKRRRKLPTVLSPGEVSAVEASARRRSILERGIEINARCAQSRNEAEYDAAQNRQSREIREDHPIHFEEHPIRFADVTRSEVERMNARR